MKTLTFDLSYDLGNKTVKSFQGCMPPQGLVVPTQQCFTIDVTTPGPFTQSEQYLAVYDNTQFIYNITFTGTYEPLANVKLKYQILGVTYAPPGSQSQVNYVDSSMLGTSTSDATSYQTSEKITISAALDANKDMPSGSVSYTEEKDNSSSISISNSNSNGVTVRGPQSSAAGLDHDYDVIWVWLNPIAELQIEGVSSVLWNGYTYNPADDAATMEVVPLYAIWLKNPSMIPAETADRLKRSWDTSGVGALTTTDYAHILHADPFQANAAFDPNTDTSGRYDLVAGQTVSYEPPPAGGLPITETYSLATSTTSAEGQAAKYTYAVSFTASVDVFTYVKLTSETTYTTTDSWSKNVNSTTGKTASVSITGPQFSDNYTGPVEFQVWRDNVYGSFMFFPVQ